MASWMQLIAEDNGCKAATTVGSVISGLSSAETYFEPVTEGLLKLTGSSDFAPTGEELWRRRLELIPQASESCPWATIDAGSLERSLGKYTWVAEGSEAGDSVEVRSQAQESDDSWDSGSLAAVPLRMPAKEERAVDDEEARQLREYTTAWVQRLEKIIAEDLAK